MFFFRSAECRCGMRTELFMCSILFSGDHGARAIPVPIPNTEVKTRSGDGTASLGGGRVARCRIFLLSRSVSADRLFFCPERRERGRMETARWMGRGKEVGMGHQRRPLRGHRGCRAIPYLARRLTRHPAPTSRGRWASRPPSKGADALRCALAGDGGGVNPGHGRRHQVDGGHRTAFAAGAAKVRISTAAWRIRLSWAKPSKSSARRKSLRQPMWTPPKRSPRSGKYAWMETGRRPAELASRAWETGRGGTKAPRDSKKSHTEAPRHREFWTGFAEFGEDAAFSRVSMGEPLLPHETGSVGTPFVGSARDAKGSHTEAPRHGEFWTGFAEFGEDTAFSRMSVGTGCLCLSGSHETGIAKGGDLMPPN